MKYLLIFLLFAPTITNCQGINNNWMIGGGGSSGPPYGTTIIDFSTGFPIQTYDSLDMTMRDTHANISDTNGNLLFYTNGLYIADATGDTMQNGSGINPGFYLNIAPGGMELPQAALILKAPGNNPLYYLFHNTLDFYSGSDNYSLHLYLTIIDISLNNGLGAVIQKNISLINDTLNVGKLTATKHANGRDWWVISHRANSNIYYKLLVTPYGLPSISNQQIGSNRLGDMGQVSFSPNGFWYSYYAKGVLDLYNFDRCSGNFYNALNDTTIPDYSGYLTDGCAFSPYSDMLYVGDMMQVFQYPLGSVNIISSRTTVATYDGFYDTIGTTNFNTEFGQMALASDGKIYIATLHPSRYFHTIHYPYFPGIACNLVQHDLMIPSLNLNTIPNHLNHFLGNIPGSLCDTVVGLNNFELMDISLKINPNPSFDNCTITFPTKSCRGELEIVDILGKTILKEEIAPWSQIKQLDISKLKQGLYFCKINWNESSTCIKFIKL